MHLLKFNVIRISSVGVVETFCLGVVESFTDCVALTSCLGAIFTCSIYDVAVTCYFGEVLTSPNKKMKVMDGDVIGRCKVIMSP